jgi:hypothetical protein
LWSTLPQIDNSYPPDPLIRLIISPHGALVERGGGILYAYENVTRCGGVELYHVHRGILILGRREWVSVVECGRVWRARGKRDLWEGLGTT